MKREILTCLFIFTVALTSCRGTGISEKTSEAAVSNEQGTSVAVGPKTALQKAVALDLSGNWEQEGADTSESHQAGYISADRIEIFWIMDEGRTKSIYWAGSYEAPEAEVEEYVWDSFNDTEVTGTALLASSDESKTFTYKDGKISYEVSIMGQTSIVELVPSDTY